MSPPRCLISLEQILVGHLYCLLAPTMDKHAPSIVAALLYFLLVEETVLSAKSGVQERRKKSV